MRQLNLYILCFFVLAMYQITASAQSKDVVNSSDSVLLMSQNQFLLAQQGQCSQLQGPFVTQSTAWQRLQEAENQGYSVSGVFPCEDGYCFNVFLPC